MHTNVDIDDDSNKCSPYYTWLVIRFLAHTSYIFIIKHLHKLDDLSLCIKNCFAPSLLFLNSLCIILIITILVLKIFIFLDNAFWWF